MAFCLKTTFNLHHLEALSSNINSSKHGRVFAFNIFYNTIPCNLRNNVKRNFQIDYLKTIKMLLTLPKPFLRLVKTAPSFMKILHHMIFKVVKQSVSRTLRCNLRLLSMMNYISPICNLTIVNFTEKWI